MNIIAPLTVSALVLANSASAATCADRTVVVERLKDYFSEELVAVSVSGSANVLEVYSNPNNETWTILLSLPAQHLTCMVASGKGVMTS